MAAFLMMRSQRVAASTVKGDRAYLERFLDYCQEQQVTELQGVRPRHLKSYQLWLQTQPGKNRDRLSDTYIHRSLHIPRLFLMWAREAGHILLDFSSFELPWKSEKLPVVPTQKQMKALIEAPDAETPTGLRDRLILEFFYVLGLRRKESHQLNLDDIDQGHRTVRVLGKGNKERLLPISPGLWGLLEHYFRWGRARLRPYPEEMALWVSPSSGGRVSYSCLRDYVRDYSRALGMEFHPHQLRHACATHLLEAGAELPYIQEFLGHARLSSTQRYTRVRPLELHQEFLRCHPRARFERLEDD